MNSKNPLPILVLALILPSLLFPSGEDPVARGGIIRSLSLDKGGIIRQMVLGIEARRPVFYKLILGNRILRTGRLQPGINPMPLQWEELDRPGPASIPLVLECTEGTTSHTKKWLLEVEYISQKSRRAGAGERFYSIELRMNGRPLLTKSRRVTEISRKAGKPLPPGQAYNEALDPVLPTGSMEAQLRRDMKYGVSLLDLGALAIRQILRDRQENKSNDPETLRLHPDMEGGMPRPSGPGIRRAIIRMRAVPSSH